ncbi:hypothetical protein L604_003200000130 [Bacillus subtilis J27]|nr:hypothetical protein L604_003200000130 [Bacillus subtilis J27]
MSDLFFKGLHTVTEKGKILLSISHHKETIIEYALMYAFS